MASASCCPSRASPRASRTPTTSCTRRRGPFILTLYEKRVDASDLPFYLGLMEHLAEHGVTCPTPVRDARGPQLAPALGAPGGARHLPRRILGTPAHGRPLRGRRPCAGPTAPRRRRTLPMRRANALGLAGWRPLYERFADKAGADRAGPGAADRGRAAIARSRPGRTVLPEGVIHADLFPDNVFFLGDRPVRA